MMKKRRRILIIRLDSTHDGEKIKMHSGNSYVCNTTYKRPNNMLRLMRTIVDA